MERGFLRTLIASQVNRYLYENADKIIGYDMLIELFGILVKKGDIESFLRTVYNSHFYDKILIPHVRKWMEKRFGQ